jgi:hypothetical protein
MASESGDSNYEHGSFDTWEDKKKNIFVLTSAGKPIFSRYVSEFLNFLFISSTID